MTSRARILIADDHVMVRRGLRMVLDAEPDLRVVAEAGDGAEAVAIARDVPELELAILDVSMPRMTGLQAAAELTRRRPDVRVLMLSMHDNEQYLFEALSAGACGYVLKSAADRDLVEACRAALRGEPFLYPSAIAALIRDYLDRARDGEDAQPDPLTPREAPPRRWALNPMVPAPAREQAPGDASARVSEVRQQFERRPYGTKANQPLVLVHRLGIRPGPAHRGAPAAARMQRTRRGGRR